MSDNKDTLQESVLIKRARRRLLGAITILISLLVLSYFFLEDPNEVKKISNVKVSFLSISEKSLNLDQRNKRVDFESVQNQVLKMEDLKDKQANVEKKLNQLDRKLDQVLKAISKINTAGTGAKNKPKQQNKRKPADPNYVHKLDQGNSMYMGNPNAKVTITEFFDFQ